MKILSIITVLSMSEDFIKMMILIHFARKSIDDMHISHNASGMEANIRVLLIRNSSSHSSLDVNGLELPCLAATLCFTRLHNQGSSLMRS